MSARLRALFAASVALVLWVLASYAPARTESGIEPLPPVEPEVFSFDGPTLAAESSGDEAIFESESTLFEPRLGPAGEPWTWQILPEGLIYRSYLASVKEPRIASVWSHDAGSDESFGNVTLGGRVGLLRHGTANPARPDGWQFDLEGAAMPRLGIVEPSAPLISTDYRFGFPLTYGAGPFHAKLAFYHVSSHLGDEFMLLHPDVERINYVRNAIVLGTGYYWTDDVRLYGEVAYAPNAADGAEPVELQFGVDYSPAEPSGTRGAPFAAFNGHLREEVHFGGNLVVQAGWQWRGEGPGHLFRAGLEYFNGKSDQFEFFNEAEERLGVGLWYDY